MEELLEGLEGLLDIRLERKLFGDAYDPNQKNTYTPHGDSFGSLRLDDLEIRDFKKLFPYLKRGQNFELVNCTIPNFSELLIPEFHDLILNNVTIKSNTCSLKGRLPWHLRLDNMQIDAKCFRCFEITSIKGFKQVDITNCHIDNIQYLNNIRPVSLMTLDNITFTYKPEKKPLKNTTRRVSISNSTFKDLSFLPYKSSLKDLQIENCKIGNLALVPSLPNLAELSIDAETRVKSKKILKKVGKGKLSCTLDYGKKPLDLSNVISIKKYLHSLDLHGLRTTNLEGLEEFKNVQHLSFSNSHVSVDAFKPIAKQIKSISFYSSVIKNEHGFKHFKNLQRFEFTNYKKKSALGSFEKIVLLAKTLKELEISDSRKIEAPKILGKFRTLETLKIQYDIPVETAKQILKLDNLKRLQLNVSSKKKCVLSLKKMIHLESLILDADIKFIGFKHLRKLKALKLGENLSGSKKQLNSIPKLRNLTRLNISNYNLKVNGLDQFPNLEFLRLNGCPKIRLGKLKKLKVLDLDNSGITDFTKFEELPKLEKLNLTYTFSDTVLKDIWKFPNLKSLALNESQVNDISDLEPLKKLKYLDLYYTDVKDVTTLNTLPNLQEVNLATCNNIDLEKQLERPEIALYCGLPNVYLWIWDKDDFGI